MSYKYLVLFIIIFLVAPLPAYGDGQPVINEFLPHPSTGNKEWVELYVPDGIDITNYWIDDDTDFVSDSGSSGKKQITSAVQGSDSKHVVFELSSSIFNNDGDTIALFSSDGTLMDHYTYSFDPGIDISIGRAPDATGDFQVLASVTRGSSNSNPKPPDTATPVPTEKLTPTDKLTPTMKPTVTPKPAKSSTATNAPTTTNSTLNAITGSSLKGSFTSLPKKGSTGAYPTAILGASTKSAEKKTTPLPRKSVLVKGASSSLPQVVAVSVGGLLFLGCGILIYLRKQGIWPWNKRE